jgi:hypothetical protein
MPIGQPAVAGLCHGERIDASDRAATIGWNRCASPIIPVLSLHS